MKLYSRSALFLAVLMAMVSLGFSQNSGLPQEKIAAVYGQNIHYFEVGQGPTVILLHGMGGSKEQWFANIGALASKYHVYAIDQIGFGQSDKPLLDYRIATFTDFLYGFMQAEKIAKATMVGNRSADGSPWTLRCSIQRWSTSWCWWMRRVWLGRRLCQT